MVRILVADDDASILELIHVYLTREGYSVHRAHDGQEAFDMLSDGKWDLIILDVMMPAYGWVAIVYGHSSLLWRCADSACHS